MSKNALVVGETRVGMLILSEAKWKGEHIPCALEDDGKHIEVRIPLQNQDWDGQLCRWFNGSLIRYGDDPAKVKFDYEPPTEAIFWDDVGTVGLIGCDWIGASMGTNPGLGTIRVQWAVFDADIVSETGINAMKCQIPHMTEWMGMQTTQTVVETDTTHGVARPVSLTLTTTAAPRTSLSRRMNLSVSSTWSSKPTPDGTLISAPAELRTERSHPKPWQTHWALHGAIRELIEIAAWEPLGVSHVKVSRDDDPFKTMDGKSHGTKWCNAVTRHIYFNSPAPEGRLHTLLFKFDDIGTRGIGRWLRLRDEIPRAIQQFHGLLYQGGLFLEVRQMNIGAALEAVGYFLALDRGASAQEARNEAYKDRMKRIRAEIPSKVLDSNWPERSRLAFMASKHADATQPTTEEQLIALRENILALRYWIAKRLGASDQVLERRAQQALREST